MKVDIALAEFRVLDLTDSKGHYCGKLLADLGADVIKIEKPGGDQSRHRGAFKGDVRHHEKSLHFLYFNTNKRGITLDFSTSKGRQAFLKLVSTADVVIESFQPGVMKTLGLDYPALTEINPRLVMASITGFGQTGPYKHYKAPDIVCFAVGGVMYMCGEPGRPPLLMPYEYTYQIASIYAAFGILLALFNRQATQHGQYIDMSIQEVQASQQYLIVNYSGNEQIVERLGPEAAIGGGAPSGVFRCRDGYVHFHIMAPRHWKTFFEWMGSPKLLADKVWENRHFRSMNMDVLSPFVREFAMKHTKAELYELGQSKHLPIAPVNDVADFVNDIQVKERKYFVEMEHPSIGKHSYPGPPYKLSTTPCRFVRSAPLLGEHNQEILGKLTEVVPAKPTASQGMTRRPSAYWLPFEKIRVVDLTQAIAGPEMTKLLAEHGAEVIKVESGAHDQRGRSVSGMDPRIRIQQIATFTDNNRNKLGITVNLNTDAGREIIKRLVKISHVIAENFSPRVMERWGLNYPQLREVNPGIIMVSLPGLGLTGPRKDFLTVAQSIMSLTGMYGLWAYPRGEGPAGSHTWQPDYIAAAHSAVAVMAALHYRANTGKGQLIDLAQVESLSAVLGPMYLDYMLNGRVQEPLGSGSSYTSPHGCYRCKGQDRWCVIAVFSEEEWRSLSKAIGDQMWCKDPKFSTVEGRIQNREELDRHIEEWTIQYTPHQVMRMLQKVGVAAGAVQNAEDLYFDPHLRHRGFIQEIHDAEIGTFECPGTVVRLSETLGTVGPCANLGEHNQYVFGELLGMSEKEIQHLVKDGVLS